MANVKMDNMPEEALAQVIRSQIGSRANCRLLARVDMFRVEKELPDDLSALLGEIDRAERKGRPARR